MLTKRAYFNFFLFFPSTEEAIISKKVIALFIFCLFQNEVSLREEDSCLNVVGETTNVTSLLQYDHTVINTAHSYYRKPYS